MKKPKESDIVRACLEYLNVVRLIPAWRNNTGAVSASHDGKRRFIRFGAVGSGDIFALLPGGRFLSIEVKRPGNKPTQAQEEWAGMVKHNGGVAVVVTSVKELASELEKLGL